MHPIDLWSKIRDLSDSFPSPALHTTTNETRSSAFTPNDHKPWKKNPYHFKKVFISGLAMAKMAIHAKSGGQIEVMGLMQGQITGDSFVVTDTFSLPVEGTETRVNAADEANEYLVSYLELCRQNKNLDNPIGWYHSHPGYGCWLSGIDVSTQQLQQSFQDPFLAVVIDPERTASSGKLDIGAFRTLPENQKPSTRLVSEMGQAIPMGKAQDFGAHADRYYGLDVQSFKSSTDDRILALLWNKYWVKTLGQNASLDSRDFLSHQLLDIKAKLDEKSSSRDFDWQDNTTRISKEDDSNAALSTNNIMQQADRLIAEQHTSSLFQNLKIRIFDST